jgi:hypothetical protein
MQRIARSCVAAVALVGAGGGGRDEARERAEAAAGAASASATIVNAGSLRITPVPRSLPVTNAA